MLCFCILHVCTLERYFDLLKRYKHVSTQMGSAKLKWVLRINLNEHLKKIPVGWRLVPYIWAHCCCRCSEGAFTWIFSSKPRDCSELLLVITKIYNQHLDLTPWWTVHAGKNRQSLHFVPCWQAWTTLWVLCWKTSALQQIFCFSHLKQRLLSFCSKSLAVSWTVSYFFCQRVVSMWREETGSRAVHLQM